MDATIVCPVGALCDIVPASWHWFMPPVVFLLLLFIVGIPIAQVLHKSGRSRWWVILAFVPLVNLIALWVFAFSRWPSLDRASPGVSPRFAQA